ncbi:Epstein-Barr nuclear antigen 4, partial [Frankliniella fusca]
MPLLLKNGRRKDSDDDDVSEVPAKKAKSQTSQTKTKKLPPPTPEQKDLMLKFMLKHPNYANGRIKGKNGNQTMQRMHSSLETKLNAAKGTPRSGQKWWKCWVSIRNHNKAYATANYKVKDYKTGGGGCADVSVSSTMDYSICAKDEKYYTDSETANIVMKIIGWHNALGLEGVSDELDDSGRGKVFDGEDKENDKSDEQHSEGDEAEQSRDDSFLQAVTSTPAGNKDKTRTVLKQAVDLETLGISTMSFTAKSQESFASFSNMRTPSATTINTVSVTTPAASSSDEVVSKELPRSSTVSLSKTHDNSASLKNMSTPPPISYVSNIDKKMDTIILELRHNSEMMRLVMEHLKLNSIMVLTPSAADAVSAAGREVAWSSHPTPELCQEKTLLSNPEMSVETSTPLVTVTDTSQEPSSSHAADEYKVEDAEYDRATQEKINLELDQLLASVCEEIQVKQCGKYDMPNL